MKKPTDSNEGGLWSGRGVCVLSYEINEIEDMKDEVRGNG
jgi:hypothetical protein